MKRDLLVFLSVLFVCMLGACDGEEAVSGFGSDPTSTVTAGTSSTTEEVQCWTANEIRFKSDVKYTDPVYTVETDLFTDKNIVRETVVEE